MWERYRFFCCLKVVVKFVCVDEKFIVCIFNFVGIFEISCND